MPSRSFWQSFTVEGALDGKDSISADLTAGFNPVDGIKVKKFKLTTDGKIVGEARCVLVVVYGRVRRNSRYV